MPGKFQLTATTDGKFMFNLLASNGQVILTSQTYTTKSAAEEGVASVRANAGSDERYERNTAADGSPYFNLKAANTQIIGKSQMYSSAAAMEGGIESVKNHAADAAVEDLTAA